MVKTLILPEDPLVSMVKTMTNILGAGSSAPSNDHYLIGLHKI